MVKKLRIGKIKLSFTFRYKGDDHDTTTYMSDFRDFRLGIWFDKRRVVGSHNFKKPKEWSNNLVNDYRFGVDLFLIKFWFEFNVGGMEL